MLPIKVSLAGLALLSFALTTGVRAEITETQTQTSTTTTTPSGGTITEFGPTTITVRSKPAVAPISYTYTKSTVYVDEKGQPVSMKIVKSGVPVTVYYTQDGDKMVATKVVVRKSTTVNADGSVTEQNTEKTTETSPSSMAPASTTTETTVTTPAP
jgi:hypothetical protein